VSTISFICGYGITGIIFAILNFGIWALIFAHAIQVVTKTIMFVYLEMPNFKFDFSVKELKDLIYFGGGFTIARIANYFAIEGDNMVVSGYLGAEALGIYGRAYQFLIMPVTLFGTALDTVLFPMISKIQEDIIKIKEIFNKSIYGFSIISFPLSVFVIILAPEIINVFLGKNWWRVILPFQILSIGLYFRMSYRICDTISRAIGTVYKRAIIQILYAISIIFGSIYGARWGITGVAIAVVLSIFINFMLMVNLIIRELKGSWKTVIFSHTHGIIISIIYLPLFFYLTNLLRNFELNSLIIIMAMIFYSISFFLTIYFLLPKWILGTDIDWFIIRIKNKYLKII
jgi:PST family polysaccharide transporter